jgi:hypothetical protein
MKRDPLEAAQCREELRHANARIAAALELCKCLHKNEPETCSERKARRPSTTYLCLGCRIRQALEQP